MPYAKKIGFQVYDTVVLVVTQLRSAIQKKAISNAVYVELRQFDSQK